MARTAVAVVLIGHGLIHLLGVLLLWRLGEPGGLRYSDVWPIAGTVGATLFGFGWLVAALGFVVAGVFVFRRSRHWWPVTIGAVMVSAAMLAPSAAMAAPGLVVDALVLCFVPLTAKLLADGASQTRPGTRP